MSLINLAVLLVVGGLIYWLVLQLPLPEPFGTVLKVVVILIVILLLLSTTFGWHFRL